MGLQKLQMEDVFREIGNVGTGRCMASLSHMIGMEVSYSSPELIEMDYKSLSDWFGCADEHVVGVLIPFEGDIQGSVLQIYKDDMVRAILEGVLGQSVGQEELNGRLLDLLREVANITASTYLTTLASYTGCRILLSGAAVSMDMAGAIVTELIGTASMSEATLCIGNRFFVQDEAVDSRLLVNFQEASVRRFLDALEVVG